MKLQFTINKLTDRHSSRCFRLLVKLLTILRFYTSSIHNSGFGGYNNILHSKNDSDHVIIKFYHDKVYIMTSASSTNSNSINALNVKFNIKGFFQDYKLSTQRSFNEEDLVIIKVNLKNLLGILKRYDQLISYKTAVNANPYNTKYRGPHEDINNRGLVGMRLNENTDNQIVLDKNFTANNMDENATGADFMKDMLKLNDLKKQKREEGKRSELYGDLNFKLIKVPKSWNIPADKTNTNITGLGSLNVFYSEYVPTNTNSSSDSVNTTNFEKRTRQGFQITNNVNDRYNNFLGSPGVDEPGDSTVKLKEKYRVITHDFQIPIRLISLNNDHKYSFENISNLISEEKTDGRIYALPVLNSINDSSMYNSPYKSNGDESSKNEGFKFNLFLRRSLRFDSEFGLLLKFQVDSESLDGNFESYRLMTTSQKNCRNTPNNNVSCDSANFKILINDFKKPQESSFHIELNWRKAISCLKLESSDDKNLSTESNKKKDSFSSVMPSKKIHDYYDATESDNQHDLSEIEDSEYDKSYFRKTNDRKSAAESGYVISHQESTLKKTRTQEKAEKSSSSYSSLDQEIEEIFIGDRILIENSDWRIFQKCYETLTNCQMYVHIGNNAEREGKFCLINTVVPVDEYNKDPYDDETDLERYKLMEFHLHIKGV